jgi:mRNA interferase HicA
VHVLLKAQSTPKVYLNGKQTTLPRHGNQEIGEGLRRAILRQLDVKPKDR